MKYLRLDLKRLVLSLSFYWIVVSKLTVIVCDTTQERKNANDHSRDVQKLSRAHLEFALDLFRKLSGDDSGRSAHSNLLISPHSVATVLSQIWLGSEQGSSTWRELESLLHYKSLSSKQIHDAFLSTVRHSHDYHYHEMVGSANAMFVQAGIHVKEDYEKDLRDYYNSTIEEVDFQHGHSVATAIINRWVAQQTHGLIDNLLDTPLPAHTRLLVVNALALNAYWKNAFDPALTASTGAFHPDANTRLEIPMMTGKFEVLLGRSSRMKCRLLELPFKGRGLSMFIMLPDSDLQSMGAKPSDGKAILEELQRNLTAENLKHLFSTLKVETVQIRLPRFRISDAAPMSETLMRMGISHIFHPTKSQFTRISDSKDLFVSGMAHKVILEVTEKGAEGGAATAAGIERLGDFGHYFEVNRPFIFFIWDYHSGALLFIGRVVYPEPIHKSP